MFERKIESELYKYYEAKDNTKSLLSMELDKFEKTLPILFKYEDIKELYPNVTAFYAFVNLASKRGELRQIKRGIYALVNPFTGK